MKALFSGDMLTRRGPLLWAAALLSLCFSLQQWHPVHVTIITASRGTRLHPGWPQLMAALLATGLRMACSIALSIPLAFILAHLKRRQDILGRSTCTLINLGRTAPGVALLAVFSWFGHDWTLVFATATLLAIHMSREAARSPRAVPAHLIELCRALGMTKWQTFWRCRAPVMLPVLMTAISATMPIAWMTLCGGEYLISCMGNSGTFDGVGAFMHACYAARADNLAGLGLAAILLLIIAFETLLIRPGIFWTRRFSLDDSQARAGVGTMDTVYNFIQRRQFFDWIERKVHALARIVTNLRFGGQDAPMMTQQAPRHSIWDDVLPLLIIFIAGIIPFSLSGGVWRWDEMGSILISLILTSGLVVVALGIVVAIWVPAMPRLGSDDGMWQVLKTFFRLITLYPLVLILPLIGRLINETGLRGAGGVLVMVCLLGQWDFGNRCIDIARRYPPDLLEIARNLDVRGMLWWRKVYLPGVASPLRQSAANACITCWNLIMFAEFMEYAHGRDTLTSFGATLAETLLYGHVLKALVYSGLATSVIWLCVTLLEGEDADADGTGHT